MPQVSNKKECCVGGGDEALMAIVSGYEITEEQARALLKYDGDDLCISRWPDGNVTIDNGDEVIIEFYLESRDSKHQTCGNCSGSGYYEADDGTQYPCDICNGKGVIS
jgi:hypothetical protein